MNTDNSSFMTQQSVMRAVTLIMLITVWWGAASLLSPQLLPTPLHVMQTIIIHAESGQLFYHVGVTLLRVALAFFIALFVGAAIGIAMGSNKTINTLLDDSLIIALNIPALVIIILCYIWFGLNEVAAITAVALNKIPLVITIIREGARAVDTTLLQVGDVYNLSYTKKMRKIYLPQIYPAFMAASRSGLSLIWKIVLVVEVFGRHNGVGFQLHSYFQNFDITSIFAYTIAFVTIVLAIEIIILRPTENYVTRWRLK